RSTASLASPGMNGIAGSAVALPAVAKATASRKADLLSMSASQILRLKRPEVPKCLRACPMIELMPHSVAERAAVDERCLQSEMQTHLGCKIYDSLADFRLIGCAGAGEGLTRHHAHLADTRHERLVSVAPLLRRIACKHGGNEHNDQKTGRKD